MNRAERRKLEKEKKAEAKKAFWNMKPSERKKVEEGVKEYVSEQFRMAEEKIRKDGEQMKKNLEILVQRTWDNLEICLAWAMREAKISEQRIDKIFASVNKRMKEEEDIIEITPNRIEDKYVVMNKEDYLTYMSEIMDVNCKDCNNKHSKCSIYQMLEQYGVPRFDGVKKKKNCKYSY